MTKNKSATRFYSSRQEAEVHEVVGGKCVPNSGAGTFACGDVLNNEASLLCECKCSMTPKNTFSIKKEWLGKIEGERKSLRLDNSCLAFNFGPDEESYYVINKKLMKFLISRLEEDYK